MINIVVIMAVAASLLAAIRHDSFEIMMKTKTMKQMMIMMMMVVVVVVS